jgi:23S rRNA (guanosine2251-2'-O)-methyltransferase
MKKFRHQHSRPKKNTLIVGREAVKQALEQGKQLEKIYVQANAHGEWLDEIKLLAAKQLAPISKVPIEKLNNLNVSNHEGCVAQISKIQYQDLQSVISFVVENGEIPLFVMLDGITDIRNIGAIARSAYALGAQAIIIPEKGVGALNEDAILTSAGALEQISVCRVQSLMKAVDDLHLNGIKVFASEMTATTKIYECNFTDPCAVVLGGEEHGIYPALMKICDEKFQIPMPGNFESLNVSVAAGVTLYEVARQRKQQ